MAQLTWKQKKSCFVIISNIGSKCVCYSPETDVMYDLLLGRRRSLFQYIKAKQTVFENIFFNNYYLELGSYL